MTRPDGAIAPETAWTAAQARLYDELGWLGTHSWLPGLRLRSADRGLVVLEAASSEVRAEALERFEQLKAALSLELARPIKLRLTLARARKARVTCKLPAPEEEVALEPERVSPRHQLSAFLTGAEAELPLRFALEAVEHPGRWHPLLFHGRSGSGKTHLLQGVVNAYRRRQPTARVVYTSGHRFSRQFVLAMRRRQTTRFHRLYRDVDLLVIDDLHQVAGKRGTERELCFTLDHLQLAGAQVVLASDAAPHQLSELDASLQGRLLGGQVVPLQPPSTETRRQIIKAHSARLRLRLGEEVVDFLSRGIDLDARELLAALTRLEAHQRLEDGRLSLERAREILADLIEPKLVPATLEGVAAFVAERLGSTAEQLRGRSRKPSAVRARLIAMALGRDLTGLTLREVGAFFGERSCACVHAAQKRAAELCGVDPQVSRLWGDAARRFQRPQPATA